MTKKVTQEFLMSASLKDLMKLIRTRDLVLESVDLSPDQARKLLATRLAGVQVGPNIADVLENLELEESDRYLEAIDLIDASSLLIA
ncbi:MAG: hypothetical protein KDD61_03290 [Bdellovibrionales bacterium]|nr:hypothetical protein [Bdellovibrionales bacterium]